MLLWLKNWRKPIFFQICWNAEKWRRSSCSSTCTPSGCRWRRAPTSPCSWPPSCSCGARQRPSPSSTSRRTVFQRRRLHPETPPTPAFVALTMDLRWVRSLDSHQLDCRPGPYYFGLTSHVLLFPSTVGCSIIFFSAKLIKLPVRKVKFWNAS